MSDISDFFDDDFPEMEDVDPINFYDLGPDFQRRNEWKISRRKQIKQFVIQRENYCCFYCKRKVHFERENANCFGTVDHIIEKHKGGNFSRNNLVLCCYRCNQKRNCLRLSAEDFLIWVYENFEKWVLTLKKNEGINNHPSENEAFNFVSN